LHYAAFKGYIEILDYLEGTGADQEIKTKSGLNVLHLSAQGDQIKSFVFYQNKISIDCLDERKSTPLHWASFSGS
jgi:ankyrin repeat protein